jgi:hypothetical protein
MQTLQDLLNKSNGNFRNIVIELINEYGADIPIQYHSRKKNDHFDIELIVNSIININKTIKEWNGNGYKYVAYYFNNKTIIKGKGNYFVQTYYKTFKR